MPKKPSYKLTTEQRALLDQFVIDTIELEGRCAASTLSLRAERTLWSQLPPRQDDFYRYVDASLQRLRRAGAIEHVRDRLGQVWQRKEQP